MGKKKNFTPGIGVIKKKRCSIKFKFADVAAITGTTLSVVWKASSRGLFNCKDLESIIGYVIRTREKKGLPKLGQEENQRI